MAIDSLLVGPSPVSRGGARGRRPARGRDRDGPRARRAGRAGRTAPARSPLRPPTTSTQASPVSPLVTCATNCQEAPAQARAVDLDRVAGPQPGPAGAAAEVSHAATEVPGHRPLSTASEGCAVHDACPPYPERHGARPPAHPDARRRSPPSPTARWPSASRRSSAGPSRRRPTRSRAPWCTPRSRGSSGTTRPATARRRPRPAELEPGLGGARRTTTSSCSSSSTGRRPRPSWPTPGTLVDNYFLPGGPQRGPGGRGGARRRDRGRRHAPARHHRPPRRDGPTGA